MELGEFVGVLSAHIVLALCARLALWRCFEQHESAFLSEGTVQRRFPATTRLCDGVDRQPKVACYPLRAKEQPEPASRGNLCLTCGLCCDGSIFADVKLLPGENADRLLSLGIPLQTQNARARKGSVSAGKRWRFTQPCAALDGCSCKIYASRPQYCRQFECLLLKKLVSGDVDYARAERLVRFARRQIGTIDQLLRSLGQTDDKALASRFRELTKRLEKGQSDLKTARLFGKLTVAFHKLNQVLQQHFYSPPS